MRLIDVDELKEHKFVSINCYLKSNCDNGFSQYKQGWNDAIDAIIDNAPTVKTFTLEDIEEQYRKGLEKGLSEWETERPQGEWKLHRMIYYCSECSRGVENQENFCPNCGADMRKETKNDTP